MEPDRWKRVKELLEIALRKDAGEREAFVRSACGGDEGVRREVMSLLGSADAMGDFIEEPMFKREPDTLDDTVVERDRIGSFKLLRSLGHGGMGVVYLAARADEEFEQQVAIKLIKRGMDSEEIVSRFRHERQILAQLVHPFIARLLDGGTTEDGLPYFVMEYVDGEPIRSYCDSQALSTAQRLALFRKVCAAVQFAHQNLVVHRDLKPGNILVTAADEPKLLDFGIAKLLTPGAQLTELMGSRPLTPEYASPEQLRGEPVTTVSDVFSLGVLLYELLTGIQPFYGKGTKEGDSWPGSRPDPPDKPSSVVLRDWHQAEEAGSAQAVRERSEQARKLRRRLSGDLDHIVLKAMRYEPQERYSSVEQLSEDIARHLEGRPILARRGSWVYRSRKFVRRHSGKLAAALVVIALIVSTAFGANYRRRAKQEEERAEQQNARAEAIGEFMLDILSGSDPNESRTLGELVARGVKSVPDKLKDYPPEQAVFLATMGQAYRKMGLLDSAEEMQNRSMKIRREHFGPDHPLVANNLGSLALLRRHREDFVKAEELMLQALAIKRRHRAPDSPWLAGMIGGYAGILKELGDFEAAIGQYREALDMKYRLPADVDDRRIPTGLNSLGSGLQEVGRLQEAESLHRQALAMVRQEDEPSRWQIAIYSNTLATALRDQAKATDQVDQEKLEEAEPLFRESLAIRREVYVDKPSMVATVLRNLALCKQWQEKYAEAAELYGEALAIHREKPVGRQLKLAIILRELATLQIAQAEYAAAETSAREALEIFRTGLPEGHWRIADAESVLGGALAGLGRVEEAKPLLRQSAEVVTYIKTDAARESREARARLEALEGTTPKGKGGQ